MARTNATFPKTSSPFPRKGIFHFVGRHRVIPLLLLIILAGGTFVVVHNYQLKQAVEEDKRRFAQADKDVQKVVADIIAVTGQPYKSKGSKSCFLPSVKFEAQTISCRVEQSLFYVNLDPNEATDLFHRVSESIQSEWTITSKAHSMKLGFNPDFQSINEVTYNSTKDYQQVFEVYQDPETLMVCRVTYFYYLGAHPPEEGYITVHNGMVLYISIGCGDNAKIVHFPVRE